jgi:hypothetical protein
VEQVRKAAAESSLLQAWAILPRPRLLPEAPRSAASRRHHAVDPADSSSCSRCHSSADTSTTGIILPGVGQGVHPVAFVSRAACLAGGALVGATALSYQRHWRGACLACGRTGKAARPARPPRWAWLAAWVAVAGCLVRVLARSRWDSAATYCGRAGGSLLLFEAGFLLAGTVLPLALVYRWGRVFPGWVPLLAGRGVPRWLVLGPALGSAWE